MMIYNNNRSMGDFSNNTQSGKKNTNSKSIEEKLFLLIDIFFNFQQLKLKGKVKNKNKIQKQK